MATVRLLLVALLLALPFWVARTAPAHACSCIPNESTDPIGDAVGRTDFIVLGTVRELGVVDPNLVPLGSYAQTEVQWTLDVQEFLKGSGPDVIGVRSMAIVGRTQAGDVQIQAGTDPACGYAPEVGVPFLYFLSRRDDGQLTSGGCGIHQPVAGEYQDSGLSLLAQVRQILRSQASLPDTGSGPTRHGAPIVPLAAASALAAIGLAANAAFVLRRRSS